MKKQDYNTIKGIEKSLKSYNTFWEMINERHEAGYKRDERLYEYYVLGRYYLDTCGNLGTATGFIPVEKIFNFPVGKVFTKTEFWDFIERWSKENIPNILTREEMDAEDFDWAKNKRPYPISISFSMGNDLPPAYVKCSHCNKGWEVEYCHKTKRLRYSNQFEINSKYVGKTLTEIEKELRNTDKNTVYIFHHTIFNRGLIDLTIDKEYGYEKNKNGRKNIDENYVIEENDEVLYEKWKYFHEECYQKKIKKKCETHLANNGESYTMGNLAGEVACDHYIRLELDLAGIDIVSKKGDGEVPFSISGELPGFTFERAWTYWMVDGNMPLKDAKEMYANKEGKRSVRVNGHCGCPPPKAPYITSYHIDSWKGLKLFADTAKKIPLTRKSNFG